jgi:hypothetical protein
MVYLFEIQFAGYLQKVREYGRCGENERICRQCKKTKKTEEFEPINRKCRECKRENQKNRVSEIDFRDTIDVLNRFVINPEKTLYELRKKIDALSKEEIILMMKELSVGRLATDKKSDMCKKLFDHFSKIKI